MAYNPDNPSYNRTVTAAQKIARRARCVALLKDAADYSVSLAMLADAAGLSIPDLHKANASEKALAALEAAMFSIKLQSVPSSVIATWDARLRAVGMSRHWMAARYGLPENTPYRMLEYASGKRVPSRANVERIEAAVRRAEEESKKGTLKEGIVCQVRKRVKLPVVSARKAGTSA